MTISNKALIQAGVTGGPWFTAVADKMNKYGIPIRDALLTESQVRMTVPDWKPVPRIALDDPKTKPFTVFLDATNPVEHDNKLAATDALLEVLKTPVTVAGALMPDACPTGPSSIPVGGVVSSTHIIPGGHSADVCCSLFLTKFDKGTDPKALLDAVMATTHFGIAAKTNTQLEMNPALVDLVKSNKLTNIHMGKAVSDFGTQGDGNHFAFVGTDIEGFTYLVTHHGSRGFGARFYKAGKLVAKDYCSKACPEVSVENAWIPEGEYSDMYWEGLQIVREWTKESHWAIHMASAKAMDIRPIIIDQIFNEHNFVFKKEDGLFYHGKGATPAYPDWAPEDPFTRNDTQIIPLNMAEPILLVKGLDNTDALGFAPHGAGRNISRTKHKENLQHLEDSAILESETEGLDIRFYSGLPDISELPSAYKNAAEVTSQMETFGLAKVHTEIHPYGCIMNGENPNFKY